MSATSLAGAVLLDTCALIWLANENAMAPASIAAIKAASRSGGIFVSFVSAWEIGMLSRPDAKHPPLQFSPDPASWFARAMTGPGFRAAPCSAQIAVAASRLPGEPHRDPADRLLIATARHMNIPIVTRDEAISAYAAEGHLSLIRC